MSAGLQDEIRRRLAVSAVAGRDVAWDRLRSNPRKGDFWGCCPFHAEKTPSFHCVDPKGYFRCFGCGARGDVFGYLMRRHGLGFREAVAAAAALAGVSTRGAEARSADPRVKPGDDEKRRVEPVAAPMGPRVDPRVKPGDGDDSGGRIAAAGRIWRASVAAGGTPVETYLRSRGIEGPLSAAIRCHPSLLHLPSGKTGPAMIVAMQDAAGAFTGVHRTFLTADGSSKVAVGPAKMMLGVAAGASARLTPVATRLYLAEGIETGLSLIEAGVALVGSAVWCALSLGNLGCPLPAIVRELTIFADRDEKDWLGARRQVRAAVLAHAGRGLVVRVGRPWKRGRDGNDELLHRGAEAGA